MNHANQCNEHRPHRFPTRRWKALRLGLPMLLAAGLTAGCRAPIGADRAPISVVHHELHHSALDGGGLSDFTLSVLHRYNGDKEFYRNPAKVLQQLHEQACSAGERDLLLALAELNYFEANRLRRSVKPGEWRGARDYFLSSALYAYYYLSSELEQPQTNPFGAHPQLAREFYNYALAQALLQPGTTNALVQLEAGTRQLPLGPVELSLNTNSFPWPLSFFSEFVMADAYKVRGLSLHNRQAGLGAPLIATTVAEAAELAAPRLAVTVFLRVDTSLKDWRNGGLKASLEIYPGYRGAQVQFAGRNFPLEIDSTAPLAYALNKPSLWSVGRRQFFSSREIIKSGIYRLQPYRPGLIPVVFVHGTFSSPVAWAEMWNSLASDPVLSRRYQIWAYIYNSGNPVVWSAANLRGAISNTVNRLDPQGTDPALRQIVVIGHSQGGLLTKLTVTRTEDKLWRVLSDKSLDELKASDSFRAELRRALFVEPVPFVSRVIFVATPHRGSYRATGFVRALAGRLVSLPGHLAGYAAEQASLAKRDELPPLLSKPIPTSLDGMSPESPGLLALAEMPPAQGVTCHSIIAIKGHRLLQEDNDGIVTYRSAHVEYSASELIVHSRHSCQGKPETIQEVRRILLDHLQPNHTPD